MDKGASSAGPSAPEVIGQDEDEHKGQEEEARGCLEAHRAERSGNPARPRPRDAGGRREPAGRPDPRGQARVPDNQAHHDLGASSEDDESEPQLGTGLEDLGHGSQPVSMVGRGDMRFDLGRCRSVQHSFSFAGPAVGAAEGSLRSLARSIRPALPGLEVFDREYGSSHWEFRSLEGHLPPSLPSRVNRRGLSLALS